MSTFWSLAVCVLVACAVAVYRVDAAVGLLEVTNAKFFDDITKFQPGSDTRRMIFMQFQSPTCEHCRVYDRAYGQLANSFMDKYKANRPQVMLSKVNCNGPELELICRREGIFKFPKFVLYSDGMNDEGRVEYTGELDPEDMEEFIEKYVGPETERIGALEAQLEAEKAERRKNKKKRKASASAEGEEKKEDL